MADAIADLLISKQKFPRDLFHSWEIPQGQNLRWRQPKRLQRNYLFGFGDRVLGALEFEENYYLQRATAKTAAGEWRFKYTRYSLPKVTIQKKDNLLAETILETNWGWRGNLKFPGGYRYTWVPANFRENEYTFISAENFPVVRFWPRTRILKFESEVEINPAIYHDPHIQLLTMLGWFLILMRFC